jgi:hypothetical protein
MIKKLNIRLLQIIKEIDSLAIRCTFLA